MNATWHSWAGIIQSTPQNLYLRHITARKMSCRLWRTPLVVADGHVRLADDDACALDDDLGSLRVRLARPLQSVPNNCSNTGRLKYRPNDTVVDHNGHTGNMIFELQAVPGHFE